MMMFVDFFKIRSREEFQNYRKAWQEGAHDDENFWMAHRCYGRYEAFKAAADLIERYLKARSLLPKTNAKVKKRKRSTAK